MNEEKKTTIVVRCRYRIIAY